MNKNQRKWLVISIVITIIMALGLGLGLGLGLKKKDTSDYFNENFNSNTVINGLYINLDKRKDRRDHFENLKFKNPFFRNVSRFPAIEDKKGSIGCGKSHIMVLKYLLEKNDDYSIVCEDDLNLLNPTNFKNFLRQFDKIKNNPEWDIIVLTPCGVSIKGDKSMTDNGFFRINNSQTTTAYIIRKKMIPVLIKNFEEAVTNLLKDGKNEIYAIDEYWKKLQNDHKFYYYKDIFCGQLPGYSDIENKNVNYNQGWGSRKE